MERSSPNTYFADKFRHLFKSAEQMDVAKLEQARESLRILHEINRKTLITPYAKTADIRPRSITI